MGLERTHFGRCHVKNIEAQLKSNEVHQIDQGFEVETITNPKPGEKIHVTQQFEWDFKNPPVATIACIVSSWIV
jgi:hypothetical protein